MFPQWPLQIFLFWTIFLFLDVVDTFEKPAWATVGWDMPPQDSMPLSVEQPSGIYNSLCEIWRRFPGLGLSKRCLRVLDASCKVALCISVILFLLYLLPRLKTIRKKRMIQAPVSSSAVNMTTEWPPDTEEMLFILVANTSKMMKYMRLVARHYRKEARHHKLRKTEKAEDTDDKQYFAIGSHHHSSSGDTTMYGI